MIDPKTFAASTLALLQEDPRRYRNFGSHWYLVKALLKRFYTVDNLHLLGDYTDPAAAERMPQHASLDEALAAAVEEYRQNASFGLGSNVVTDASGEAFTLIDPDAGI
jgi:hypothetical protein